MLRAHLRINLCEYKYVHIYTLCTKLSRSWRYSSINCLHKGISRGVCRKLSQGSQGSFQVSVNLGWIFGRNCECYNIYWLVWKASGTSVCLTVTIKRPTLTVEIAWRSSFTFFGKEKGQNLYIGKWAKLFVRKTRNCNVNHQSPLKYANFFINFGVDGTCSVRLYLKTAQYPFPL